METDLVSVIVPTYGRIDYLKETIESILVQTYSNVEIIVVSDGYLSPVKDLCLNYKQVKYIECPEVHQPAYLRNRGMEAGQGEWIAFCDDDDMWHPRKLERQISYMQINKLSFSCTYCNQINESTDDLGPLLNTYKSFLLKYGRGRILGMSNYICNSSVVIHKDVVNQVGFFRESIQVRGVEDLDYWIRIYRKFELGVLDEYLTSYRVHSNNLSSNKSAMYANLLHAYQELFDGKIISSVEYCLYVLFLRCKRIFKRVF